jgi:D-inositol-3-phosphate glycosyltransferase
MTRPRTLHPATRNRLVLVAPMHPYRGGIAHFAETMYEGLQARGHEMEAVTFTRQYPERLFPGKTQYVTDDLEHPAPARRLLDTINPASWFKTARHLTRWRPDALIFHYWMPFFAPAFGTVARRVRKAGAKVLVVVHNALPHERRVGDVALGRYFLKTAHGCIVMADAVARDLETLGVNAPVRQIGHPVYDLFGPALPRDEARRLLGLPPEAPVLLFFGFVRKYKGLHVLLESLPRVVAALPGARLVVAGEFYEDEALHRTLIDRYGLHEHVHLHADYIPDADVSRYFSAADVVVQPYVSATQSGVAQIAFHFDKPLIISDVGGLAEVVPHEKAGLVVPPEDPAALAEAVVRFFEEKMSTRLAEGVRQEKQKYSWDRLYEAVEAFL